MSKRPKENARPGRRSRIASILIGLVRGVLPVGIVAAGVFAAYWFNTNEPTVGAGSTDRQETARPVELFVAEPGDHAVVMHTMGEVIPAKEATIRPRVAGMIESQHESFVPGGYIAAGETVLQIEKIDYQQALLQRESELAGADANLKIELGDQALAEEELSLLEVDIPEINRELILRIPQVSRAEAQVRSAEAAVLRARLDVDRTTIRAPFDGHVVTRAVTEGNNVSPGEQLATFVGSEEYWIELTIPPSMIAWVDIPESPEAHGSPAIVRFPRAWGELASRKGFVKQLVARLEPRSRQARLLVAVEDPVARLPENDGEPLLILDAFVDVEIRGRELKDSYRIERNLIREGDLVWVMGEDDRLAIRQVEIAFRGRDYAFVTQGLLDGDRVISTNLQAPVEGMLLRDASRDDAPTRGPEEDGDADG